MSVGPNLDRLLFGDAIPRSVRPLWLSRIGKTGLAL
jgi:hypothetical protein